MNNYFYNNIGICATSIISVLKEYNDDIELTKIFLIMPFISHKQLLNHLCRATTNIQSIDSLIIDKNSHFTNFNKRFNQSIILTINTIQYLNDIENIAIKDNKVVLIKDISYNNEMGKRAEKIYKASANISNILKETNEKLFLNLRIEL